MTQRREADPEQRERPSAMGRRTTRALEVAENVVYGGIAVLLLGAAVVLLGVAAKTAWGVVGDFSQQPLLEMLDVLLLVFIVVELLFAVRATVERRELVAEPFLIIGIIASIKEIVVLSVEAAGAVAKGREFTNRMVEIGVLGVLVLLLGLTSWLLRRKEREPEEA
ncbi:phosphate-starvation-inducible PsiE family protein [Geodermatophilus sp. SYSU D00691]